MNISKNAEKADIVLEKIAEIPGAYGRPLVNLVSGIKYMVKEDIYRVTIDLPATKLGGNQDVRQVLEAGDKLNFVTTIVFIDPKEITESKDTVHH